MPLSWNEIKHRAFAFSKEWKEETREEPVKKLSGDWGFIDLFWPKTLLAEHKSAGKDLARAAAQGMEYIRALVDSGRGTEVPR